jgi:CheY-like chemotaxis protein
VLLIDDSELVAEAVIVALRDEFDVRVAQSLGEFDAIFRAWSPHIVLTDVHMPGVTGPQLCRRIKEGMAAGLVPVVLFSDIPPDRLQKLAEASGADSHFSKAQGLECLPEALFRLCEEIIW